MDYLLGRKPNLEECKKKCVDADDKWNKDERIKELNNDKNYRRKGALNADERRRKVLKCERIVSEYYGNNTNTGGGKSKLRKSKSLRKSKLRKSKLRKTKSLRKRHKTKSLRKRSKTKSSRTKSRRH